MLDFATGPQAKSSIAATYPDDDRGLLGNVEIFADVGARELNRLEQACRYRRFAAGEQIIERDGPTTDVFFVIRGAVRVVCYSLLGREIVFDEMGPGASFGELSAIDGQPRSASVVATCDSLIVALPGNAFVRLLEENPAVARKVMTRLATMLRAANERIMDLSTLAANDRVHAELLRRARQHMAGEDSARIAPIPVHGEIASRVSTTRETVARVFGELARQGIVERTKDALIVRSVLRLQDMVGDARG